MAYFNDPSQGAAISEANNPAARAFALARIQQLVNAHLLGAMPSNMADPAATWRGLSQGLSANHTALLAFLAAGQHPAQHSGPQQQAVSAANALAAHLAQGGQAPQLVSENGGGAPLGWHSAPNFSPQVGDAIRNLLVNAHASAANQGVVSALPQIGNALRQSVSANAHGPVFTPGPQY